MQAQSSTAPAKVVLAKKTVNCQILERFYQGKTQFPSITSLALKTCIHQIYMIPVCTKAIRDKYASDMLKHNLKTLTLLYIHCRFLLFLFSELVFDTDWSWYIWSSLMYLSP
jgi:L-asparagine transporter-like permease